MLPLPGAPCCAEEASAGLDVNLDDASDAACCAFWVALLARSSPALAAWAARSLAASAACDTDCDTLEAASFALAAASLAAELALFRSSLLRSSSSVFLSSGFFSTSFEIFSLRFWKKDKLWRDAIGIWRRRAAFETIRTAKIRISQ